MRQHYDLPILQQAVDQYEIGAIRESALFKSGFENSNYRIDTDKGVFVIKIFEGTEIDPMTPDYVAFEAHVMDTCAQAGVKVPKIMRAGNGQLTVPFAGKTAVVMEYIDGICADDQPLSDRIALQAGEELAKMDVALGAFADERRTRQDYAWDAKNFSQLETKLPYLPQRYDKKPLEYVFGEFRAIRDTLGSLPRGLIHNDAGAHNMIIKGDTFRAYVDFSDMAFSPYIQNIAVPSAQSFFAHNWSPEQLRVFLRGYRSVRLLSEAELGLLFVMTMARHVTIITEFGYWNHRFGEDAQRTEAIDSYYGYLNRFISYGRENFEQLLV